MGFIKNIGEVVGNVTGTVLGGGVQFIGGAMDSDYIKEIGDGVRQSTKNTGKLLGTVAEGTYKTVKGTVTKDKEEMRSGLKDVGGAVGETIVGVGKGIGNLVTTSYDILDSVATGDNKEVKKGLSKLAKGAAIGAIGIGILDGLDIIGNDEIDFVNDDMDNEFIPESDVNPHFVDSYTRADGTFVDSYWRDGDGNTSIDLTLEDNGGYLRNNVISDKIYDNESELIFTNNDNHINDDVSNELVSKVNIPNDTSLDLALENTSEYFKNIFDNDDTNLINTNTTDEIVSISHVDPHHVDSYVTADGTLVDSYWRDGDSDTSIDLSLKDGGGFLRNNL